MKHIFFFISLSLFLSLSIPSLCQFRLAFIYLHSNEISGLGTEQNTRKYYCLPS